MQTNHHKPGDHHKPGPNASAILWSEINAYLDTLEFITSNDLNVTFAGQPPQENVTARDNVFYKELRKELIGPYKDEYVNFDGERPLVTAVQKWDLKSTGSGTLKLALDFSWEYNFLPGFKPDLNIQGPDCYFIDVKINDKWMNHSQMPMFPTSRKFSYSAVSDGPDAGMHFDLNTISTLTISVCTVAMNAWHIKPNPPVFYP